MDIREIAKLVLASAFEEDTVPVAGMVVRLTPKGRREAKSLLEQSNRQNREFGGYVEGTVAGITVTLDGFSHEVTGQSQHVNIPWLDSDKTVGGWHSHPDQYEGSNLVPETEENGNPSPSTGDDLPSFDAAKERGHISVILGNGRIVVYDGRKNVYSEAL